MTGRSTGTALAPEIGVALWIALVGGATVALSTVFACATPFAALATISAFGLRARSALALVAVAWALNQAVGFGLLHYPHTADALAWGLAIGLAALAATLAAQAVARLIASPVPAGIAGFAAAFAVYEGVLFAATAILPSGEGAFSPAIVGRILLVNVLAFVALSALQSFALTIRLLHPRAHEMLAHA